MSIKENEEISGTYQITIGKFTVNVNRKPDENLLIMSRFDDIYVNIDDSYDPDEHDNDNYNDNDNDNLVYLKLTNKDTETRMDLNSLVLKKTYIENSKHMDKETYCRKFVEIKNNNVDYLLKRIYANAYEKPSPVQSITIPEIIRGADVIVQFKSGTGKTLSFLVGTLWGFDVNYDVLQYIYITSSHEVATQIYNQIIDLVPNNSNVSLCIGQKKMSSKSTGEFRSFIGSASLNVRHKSIKEEREELSKAQIIVCTVGKFYDYFFNKNMIPNINYLKAIVIDEFDAIITSKSNNNRNDNHLTSSDQQIANIMNEIPPFTQRIFFSATVNVEAIMTAEKYIRNIDDTKDDDDSVGIEPFICMLNADDYTLEGIRQYYVKCNGFDQKKDMLDKLLGDITIVQTIIFTNKIQTARELQIHLMNLKTPIKAGIFHGDLTAAERKDIHSQLLSGTIRYLISTDVAARGLDVQSINVVFNFDMPNDPETYIHRVGRSGRYGKKGVSISFITTNEFFNEMMKVHAINDFSSNNPIVELPNYVRDLV